MNTSSQASAAAVVLAHGDPEQLHRLFAALPNFEIFLHCDRRTDVRVYAAMLAGAPANVHVLPRISTHRGSWSLVAAELQGVRAAINRTRAEQIVVMSGNCYPIVPPAELQATLASLDGRSWLETRPLPYAPWSTPRNQDGGMWRLRRRFLTVRGEVLHVAGVPLRTRRVALPADVDPHGALEWKIYDRSHAVALLELLDRRPDLVDFFRHSYISDEICVASLLGSPALIGDVAGQIIGGAGNGPWYVEWRASAVTDGHPEWLDLQAFERIATLAKVPPHGALTDRPVFARKLRSTDADLLDQIDQELRT